MGYRSPKLGGGFLPPPKQLPARASRPQAALARKRRLPRHLGASSPSGNVRGGCRGWTPWAGRIPRRKERRHHIGFRILEPPLRPSKAKPDRAPFRPIQFKNASPREKEKAWNGGTGRGRTRRVREARAVSSWHASGAYERISSHHARAVPVRIFSEGGERAKGQQS